MITGNNFDTTRKSRSGVAHWRYQRYTAIMLVPLCLWLMISVIQGAGQGYSTAVEWLRSPVIAGLFIVGFVALYLHAMLGIQAVVEDYVGDAPKQAALIAIVRSAACVMIVLSIIVVMIVATS